MRDVFFKLTMVDANDGKDLTSKMLRDSWQFKPEVMEKNIKISEEVCMLLTEYIKQNISPEFISEMIDNLQET